MAEYEVDASEAKELLDETDELYLDDPYAAGIKDALGWVLGYYDRPEV